MILKNVEKIIFDVCLKECERLNSLSLNKIDESNVKYMNSMFENCNKLNKYFHKKFLINLSNFITINVKDMSYMFIDCLFLKEINVKIFDINNVEYMTHMLNTCRILTSLNLSNFNTTNLE